MPSIVLRAPLTFEAGFAAIRTELGVPTSFPDSVLDEAERSLPSVGADRRVDATHLPLVAIDPPGATDLDQALLIERRGDGYRVRYAIADVGDFVRPGEAMDREARARGTTLYCPDLRAPLLPPTVSEQRASLLPVDKRPALLWTIDLDPSGEPLVWRMERAVVRIRAAISYATAQAEIDRAEGRAPDHDTVLPVDLDGNDLTLLAEVGRLRQQREADRGGVSIDVPTQEVVAIDGSYQLTFDRSFPVEGWNAQISLLTGIVAARTMIEAGVGILRTLPPPRREDLDRLRRTAWALELPWPDDVGYPAFVRGLTPDRPEAAAFLVQATRVLRGAGYSAFTDGAPDEAGHSAIASVYAHVTAPLRRLVDRFANDVLLNLFAGHEAPAWALEALDELPGLMGRAAQRQSALERALIDFAEAVVLEPCVGRSYTAHVVDVDADRERATVMVPGPAVVADLAGDGYELGRELQLRLVGADPRQRSVRFEPAPTSP